MREPSIRSAVLAKGFTSPHQEQQFEMCARLTSLLLATVCVAGVGCASKPAEEPSAAVAVDQACVTSPAAPQANDHDTAIDSILTQPTSDPRLAQINRRMYLSLRTLDAELRREQRLAACQSQPLDSSVLQAQTNGQQDASAGADAAGPSASDAGVGAGVAAGGTARATAEGAIGSSAASSLAMSSNAAGASGAPAAHAAPIRNAGLSNASGGNGATAPKVKPGNDNDIVARRLRKAAEQETDPALRAKLWREYTDYRQGTSAK